MLNVPALAKSVDGKGKNSIKIQSVRNYFNVNNKAPAYCTEDGSLVVVQVSCVQTDASIAQKDAHQLILSCCGLFMCLAFFSLMFFSKKFQQLKVYEWDQLTVTAGDYTCEMRISQSMYTNFLADPDNVAEG